MKVPPLLSLVLRPKTTADQEKLRQGLDRLTREDPTLSVSTNSAIGDVVIGATGELHLEIVIHRLAREFNVEASVGRPQVAYKETITRAADGEMKYAARVGGRNEYGHVKIRLHPGAPGSGYVFENKISVGTIPAAYIQPVDDGIRDALDLGVLAGHPIDDVRVELYDGSYHDLDSCETAFKIAGAQAFIEAAKKAGPVLLEPVMRVEVVVPKEENRQVIASLSRRRGQIESRDDRGPMDTILARVPLAQMFGFSNDLSARTRGRGTFVMHFDRYEPAPPPEGDDGATSLVRAPLTPSPTLRDLIRLVEPDGDARVD
jgi:elongation factor G